MGHRPIIIKELSLSLPHKTCFSNFNTQIYYGERIATIGQIGSGKSSLLKMVYGIKEPNEGKISIPNETIIGYIPQILDNQDSLSGGERFSAALATVLSQCPDVLILDEPTNHLDLKNRKSLFKVLSLFSLCGSLMSQMLHTANLFRSYLRLSWSI